MNLQEYEEIKNHTYLEYCDYLQQKYGIGLNDYMTSNWEKNRNYSRTKEGLFTHHKYEDHAIMLCDPMHAKDKPYEWQLKENLVYCDYLEHLFLHILICEYPAKNKDKRYRVGIGGVLDYIVPYLNDIYSGWIPKDYWHRCCQRAIIHDKNVYLQLLKRFKNYFANIPYFVDALYSSSSFNKDYWSGDKNKALYREIMEL